MKKKFFVVHFVMCQIFSVALFSGCGDPPPLEDKTHKAGMTVGEKTFEIALEDNDTVDALYEMLPLTLNMSDMPHEKYSYVPKNLPTNVFSPNTIRVGDVMLFGADCLVVFYEEFQTTYSYTKIGRIEDRNGLVSALGSGRVTITLAEIETLEQMM